MPILSAPYSDDIVNKIPENLAIPSIKFSFWPSKRYNSVFPIEIQALSPSASKGHPRVAHNTGRI